MNMDIFIATYFLMIFLGLQQFYKFDYHTNTTLVLFGNILILEWCLINHSYTLLALTIIMMLAQLSRIYNAKN